MVRLYPRSYPDVLDVTTDFREAYKKKIEKKDTKSDKKTLSILSSLQRKIVEGRPVPGSATGWSQVHLTAKEAQYFNAITELVGVKESRAIESR